MLIGAVAMLAMFFHAETFAGLMRNAYAEPGIRVLAPAVLFACIISVYRGYLQGFENMIPTAMSQVVEAVCKAAFGIAVAVWLSQYGRYLQYVSAGALSGVTIGLFICIPLLIYYKRKFDRGLTASPREIKELPRRMRVLGQILKVSIPITLGSTFMSIMRFIDNAVIMGRLQDSLGLSVTEASGMFGMYARGLTVYNFPVAFLAPVAVTIIPAIAAARASGRSGQAGNIMQTAVKLVSLIAMPAAAGIVALSGPILIALYGDTSPVSATMLAILGPASFFVCFNIVTTAILQANGHERLMMLTLPIGGAIMVGLDYILVGNPNIGIIGSPIGTLACFMVISALNIIFIRSRVKDRPRFSKVFIKPLICAAIMGVAAYSVYHLLFRFGADIIGTERSAVTVYLAGAIFVGVVVYGVLIIATRAITREDMRLVPKGEKIANILRIK